MAHQTHAAFLEDAYQSSCESTVVAINERGGIILDKTNFYAASGGQPGDTGTLELANGSKIEIAATVCGETKQEIILVPTEGSPLPDIGNAVTSQLDWERRYKFMKMHTACHLLSVVCPYPITGAGVGENESRIDFELPEVGVTKQEVSQLLMELVNANHPVFTQWISEAELDADPSIIRSKNVKPPRGIGNIRLVCIGENSSIDSQPCGGTHVRHTGEIGEIHIGKIENKGRENRRFRIRFGTSPQG